LGSVARTVSPFKNHQISLNTELSSVFGGVIYLADEAEMGLIRLIPREFVIANDNTFTLVQPNLNPDRHLGMLPGTGNIGGCFFATGYRSKR